MTGASVGCSDEEGWESDMEDESDVLEEERESEESDEEDELPREREARCAPKVRRVSE